MVPCLTMMTLNDEMLPNVFKCERIVVVTVVVAGWDVSSVGEALDNRRYRETARPSRG